MEWFARILNKMIALKAFQELMVMPSAGFMGWNALGPNFVGRNFMMVQKLNQVYFNRNL